MRYLWAYLQERFPPQANGLLIASYFTANYFLASGAALQNREPIGLSWRFPAGCLVLLLMFFHMRVIDEHRDQEQDRLVYPDRILSRGLISLRLLRNLGILSVLLELVLSYLFGWPAFLMCLGILAFSWLIYKGFFAEAILNRHMLASAFLHMLVMPGYSLYVFSLASQTYPWFAPAPVLLYAWVSYGVGMAYELSRKTRAPADERPGLITYSSVIGPYPSAYAALAAVLCAGAISALVGWMMSFEWWYHAAVGVLFLVFAFGVLQFRLRTTSSTAASLQIYAGVFIFAFDILLAVELIRAHRLILL